MFRPLLAAAAFALLAGPAGARPAPPLPTFEADAAAVAGDTDPIEPARPAPLRIGGGGARLGEPATAAAEPRGTSAWGVAGALALVLGLFAAAAKGLGRSRFAGGSAAAGPCEALARVKLEPRASVHLVRVGRRVVLVGSAADGLTALCEIADPAEADALVAACRAGSAAAAGAGNAGRDSFRTLFGRAAARGEEPAGGEETVPFAPPDDSDQSDREPDRSAAERRLAARLRPAGAGR